MLLRIYLFATLISVLTLSVWANNTETAQDAAKDEAVIRQVVQQVQDGWNAHDGKAFAAIFAPDADYVVVKCWNSEEPPFLTPRRGSYSCRMEP